MVRSEEGEMITNDLGIYPGRRGRRGIYPTTVYIKKMSTKIESF